MALMLQVPWRADPLPIGPNADIEQIIEANGQVVQEVEGDILVNECFGEINRVPDVSRYHIGDNGQLIHHCDVPESRLQRQPQLRSIVLLVESPHKDEYQFGNINCPIAPANGASGRNIHRCLRRVLSCIEAMHIEAGLIVPGCHVVISNPIQFQTSLHAIHGTPLSNEHAMTLRNDVWRALWNEGEGVSGYIKLCFRVRLYTYRPSLIINACTGDWEEIDSLKRYVGEFVRAELQNVPLYNVSHPASWRPHRNIAIMRIHPPPNQNAGDPQQ